jgi:DNA polymerase-4
VAPIAHLDVDAFYASVELLRRPELRGKPVIVSGSGPRAVVTTASYEARKFGVGSAMPTSRALRLCPDAILIPPDFTAYRDVSRTVMRLVRDAASQVEVLGLDEAYLDLDGLVAPRAAMRRLVGDIREATGLDASVGIGPNRLVAKVASDAEKPRGFVVLSREEACERFAGSPPRLNHGRDLQRRAQFHGSDAVVPVREAVSESRETTFDVDIADPSEMERRLRELAVQLCARLREKDVRGRTVAIKVRLDDFTTVTRARTLPAPTNEPAVVQEVAAQLLRGYAPPRPVRLLGVRVASFQRGEPEPEAPSPQLALEI